MLFLEDLLTNQSDLIIFRALVKAAMLDPLSNLREIAAKVLKDKCDGMLRSGFEADEKLYLILQLLPNPPEVVYICYLPKEYIKGYSVNVHEFYLE